jgi:hypothetical protein
MLVLALCAPLQPFHAPGLRSVRGDFKDRAIGHRQLQLEFPKRSHPGRIGHALARKMPLEHRELNTTTKDHGAIR